ncbi:M56 family metallopeptidase [Kaistella montana]|uniref:M56 family metallopeptidase n=1 Tax=Kaistella montana TaxID=1849733 RepID=A0ABW5K904_9FLAO|nr:M56 family metallopeptidase [Kaistella montana]MCQ4034953.1 hypothetical protein [Kaistella montana]
MEALFIYFGKVFLASGVMFLYYQLFLKDKTFHHYNRFYLLGVLVLSMILPFFKISYFTIEVNTDIYLLYSKLQNFNSTKTLNHDFPYFQLIAFVVGLVSIFYLGKLFYGIFKIQQLKKEFSKEHFEGINFYQTNLSEAPFSFFKNLFWKDTILIQSDLGRQILKHEMVHIEQKHSRDKIFTEIVTAVFWWNPVFHLIKKEISLIHEYLADKKAIKNSDTKAFAQMLLASHFSGKQLPATSPFLNSNLKKRLTMLKKSKTKYSYARRILALPLLFALAFIYMINAKNKEITKTNREIEQMVAEIKKDTIVPKDAVQGTDGTKIQEKNQELFGDNDSLNQSSLQKIQDQIAEKQKMIEPYKELMLKKNEEGLKISQEMRAKSEEMQKLSKKKDFESPRFKNLEKEMKVLDDKMSSIFDTDEFKKNQKMLELKFIELDQLYAQIDQYYSSDAFKAKIKASELTAAEVEKKVNSPEFQKRIKDAEEKAQEAEILVNSPEFKRKLKEAEKRAKEAEKKFNSPEFKKKIAEAETKAKLATEKANSKIIILDNQNNNGNMLTNENVKIYIDKKPVSKTEMEQFPPDKIEKIEVFKKGNGDSKSGEIYITTKK